MASDGNTAMADAIEAILKEKVNATLEAAAKVVFDGGGVWDDTDRILDAAAERVRALKLK